MLPKEDGAASLVTVNGRAREALRELRLRERKTRDQARRAARRQIALQTLPNLLGTVIGGLTLILLASLFGVIESLGTGGQIVLGLILILIALGFVYALFARREAKLDEEVREAEETLERSMKQLIELTDRREREIEEMEREARRGDARQ